MWGTGWPEKKWEKPKPPKKRVAVRMVLYNGPVKKVVGELPQWFLEKLQRWKNRNNLRG